MVDHNIRHALKLDRPFVASIAEVGGLEPIVAVRTATGHVRVRHGHRRTAAAVQAGRETVPVFITGHDADYTATQAARLVSQHAKNQHRTNLSDAEELDVIAGLSDLGVSAAQIATCTTVRRGRVDHALAAARYELARTAAARYELTIAQVAVITEFAEDTETVTALLAAARIGQFDHVARLARDNRALTEQAAEITDELRCAGVAVLDTAPRDHRLDSLRTPEGDPPTPENHHDCPGHPPPRRRRRGLGRRGRLTQGGRRPSRPIRPRRTRRRRGRPRAPFTGVGELPRRRVGLHRPRRARPPPPLGPQPVQQPRPWMADLPAH